MRSKLTVAMLTGVLAIPAMLAQGPAPEPGLAGPDDGGASRRHMGPGGPDRGRFEGEGEHGRRGFGGMRGHHRGHGEFVLARLVNDPAARERLGITAEQVAKVNQQTSEFRKANIRGRAEMEVKHVELEDLMRGENPDRAAVDRKLDEIGAARLAQTKAAVHYRMAMREVLTAEQKEKLRHMMEEHRRGGFEGSPREPRGPHERPAAPNQD